MTGIEVVARREEVLSKLADDPLHKCDITDRLDISRSTVDRSVRELEGAGLVERQPEGYAATLLGTLALSCFRTYREESRKLFELETALDPLPASCDLPLEFVSHAETLVAADPVPYRPMEKVHEAITAAEEFRILLPVLYDPRFLERCYEHAVEQGNPASLVIDESVVETAKEEFPDQTAEKMACEWFSAWSGETPPYGLLLTTRDGETSACVIVFSESLGPVHAVLHTTHPTAVQWAKEEFEAAVKAANPSPNEPTEGEAPEESEA